MVGIREIIEWITGIIVIGILVYFVIFILYPGLKELALVFGLGLISNGCPRIHRGWEGWSF